MYKFWITSYNSWFLKGNMARLSQNQRLRAVGTVQAGLRQYDVAARFGVTRATITRLLTRYRLYGTVNDLQRSGRPRVTTARQDRHIRTSHLRNRLQTAVATAAVILGRTNNRISAQTVRNRLAERGIKCMPPYHGQVLTRRHRLERMNLVCQRQRWTRHQWNSILFIDESRFRLQRIDQRSRVYRRPKERFSHA